MGWQCTDEDTEGDVTLVGRLDVGPFEEEDVSVVGGTTNGLSRSPDTLSAEASASFARLPLAFPEVPRSFWYRVATHRWRERPNSISENKLD